MIPFTGRSRTITDEEASSSRTTTLNHTQNTSYLSRLLNRKESKKTNQLEQIVDTDKDLEIMTNDQINLLRTTQLYKSGIFDNNSSLIRTHRSEMLELPDGKIEEFGLVTTESINQLTKQNMNYAHLGLITTGVRGLIMKQNGAKVLIAILDTRHDTLTRQLIGVIEVDMNNNCGIHYLCPNFTIGLKDLKHIKIQVQSKGFKNFKGSNIVVDIIFLGKLSTQISPKFKIKIDEMVKTITSKGINFFGPEPVSPALLAGEEWNIKQNYKKDAETLVPTEVVTYMNKDSLSLRFKNYEENPRKTSEEDDD